MTLKELIYALERADNHDAREGLNVLIANHIGWEFDKSACWWRDELGELTEYATSPEFTASLDAALTLVGEAAWHIEYSDEQEDFRASVFGAYDWKHGNSRHSPAIAVCIAALKARSGT